MEEKEGNGDVVKSEDNETSGFDLIFDYVGGSNLYQWLLLAIVGIEVRTLSALLFCDCDFFCCF